MDEQRGVTNVRVVRLGWSGRDAGRGGLSPIGIFLVVLGALLLIEQLLPEIRVLGSALVVAVGVAALVRWAADRQTWALYVGALLVALALPGLLTEVGAISGPGWGTLFLGIAFLAIALIRAGDHGGWGWQLTVGAVLALIGGIQVAARSIPGIPDSGQLIWPVLIVGLGAVLILRGGARR